MRSGVQSTVRIGLFPMKECNLGGWRMPLFPHAARAALAGIPTFSLAEINRREFNYPFTTFDVVNRARFFPQLDDPYWRYHTKQEMYRL